MHAPAPVIYVVDEELRSGVLRVTLAVQGADPAGTQLRYHVTDGTPLQGEFAWLVVDEGLRGRGLAMALIQHAINARPERTAWVVESPDDDGIDFWPHVARTLTRAGLAVTYAVGGEQFDPRGALGPAGDPAEASYSAIAVRELLCQRINEWRARHPAD